MATLVLLVAALLAIANSGAAALQSNNLAYLSPVAELPQLAKIGQSPQEAVMLAGRHKTKQDGTDHHR